MLVLSRKVNERIMIGDNITVTIVRIAGDKVRIGIEAPNDVPIRREELIQALEATDEQQPTPSLDCCTSETPTLPAT